MITIPQNAVLQPSGYHDLVHAVVPIDENGNRLGGAASPMQTKSVDDTGNRVGSAASPVHTETPDGFSKPECRRNFACSTARPTATTYRRRSAKSTS